MSGLIPPEQFPPSMTQGSAPTVGGGVGERKALGLMPAIPEAVGPYRIVRLLGTGGMGAVYEAEQSRPKRSVALKVLRPGVATASLLKRFELEAEVLARLQHPAIAQIYEAGVHEIPGPAGTNDSLPYFAMELVKGEPLTGYAEKRGLGTRERLALLIRICEGVQHAHQKGVIHRDLKPGNILVTPDGQPKILDFGIARLADSASGQVTATLRTDIGQLVGTLPYMSPEQAAGDPAEMDTRSDVYTLGVIAFELLTGRLPLDVTRKLVPEAVRIIREEEPTRLSLMDKTLRGDVETIVSKALDKDRGRRYQSPEALAHDLERYLRDEPILARPPSAAYQLRKFARRNKTLVGGVAATLVVLVAGVITSTSLAVKFNRAKSDAEAARAESDRARGDAERAQSDAVSARDAALASETRAKMALAKSEQVAAFLKSTLQAVTPARAQGRDTTLLREVLEQAADRAEEELKGQPEVLADILATVGGAASNAALFDRAVGPLERAVALRAEQFGLSDQTAVDYAQTLATALKSTGREREAAAQLDKLIALVRGLATPRPEQLGELLGSRADVAMTLNEIELGLAAGREALEINQRLNLPDRVASNRSSIGSLLRRKGQFKESEAEFTLAAEHWRTRQPAQAIALGAVLNNLAILARQRGEQERAVALYREVLELRRKLYDQPHPDVAIPLVNLGNALAELQRVEEAEPILREAVAMHHAIYKGEHMGEAVAIDRLGRVLSLRGKDEEALARYLEARAMFIRLLGPKHQFVGTNASNLASHYGSRGEYEKAEPLQREAIAILDGQPGTEGFMPALLSGLGEVLIARGRYEEVPALAARAEEIARRVFGPESVQTGQAERLRGLSLMQLGDARDALPLMESALKKMGLSDVAGAKQHRDLGGLYVTLGRFEDAVTVFKAGFDARQALRELGRQEELAAFADDLAKAYQAWNQLSPSDDRAAEAARWKAKHAELSAASESKP